MAKRAQALYDEIQVDPGRVSAIVPGNFRPLVLAKRTQIFYHKNEVSMGMAPALVCWSLCSLVAVVKRNQKIPPENAADMDLGLLLAL